MIFTFTNTKITPEDFLRDLKIQNFQYLIMGRRQISLLILSEFMRIH